MKHGSGLRARDAAVARVGVAVPPAAPWRISDHSDRSDRPRIAGIHRHGAAGVFQQDREPGADRRGGFVRVGDSKRPGTGVARARSTRREAIMRLRPMKALAAMFLATALLACGAADDATFSEASSNSAEVVTVDTARMYELVAVHSGKALDVSGASKQNGANVQQWVRNGTPAQHWRFEPTGDGYYALIAECSGKALDVKDRSNSDGANVQQWDYGHTANQQWALDDAGNGQVFVRSRQSGKYLDVAWASTADGANVAQVNFNGGNAQRWRLSAAGAANGGAAAGGGGANTGGGAPAGWRLVWSDEFNYTGLPDANHWGYDVGGSGWGNNELEYYTDHRAENARVENGNLVIEARRENYGGRPYTSARLVTRGHGDWLYGRFEARAKLPGGRGTWPAIWMLPTDWAYGGWPASGELDIMEMVGFDVNNIHGTTHTKSYNHLIGTQRTATTWVGDSTSAFHTYAAEWSADRIDVFVDGNRYFSFANEHTGFSAWPFDKRFHLILNLAVGGSWGGVKGVDDGAFPQRMEVDYVRVYQR